MLLRAALAAVLFSSFSMATTVFYVATDNTGAQTQIDQTHSSTWLINPGTTFDLGGGIFSMKFGGILTVTQDVVFTLYQGTDATGTVLAVADLTPSQFCPVGTCNQFELHQFFFATPQTLTAGTNYFVALTSSADTVSNNSYSIKSNNFFASDITGTPVTPSPLDPVVVPEPSTMLLSGLGLVAVGLIRRKTARA